MKTTKCKPATIALLNELTQNINQRINQVKPIKLQVNSILRTVAHQKHLASLGYWALASTSHTTGYGQVVQLALSIPQDWKVKDKVEKWCLREAFKQELPNYIIKRKKNPLSHSSGLHSLGEIV